MRKTTSLRFSEELCEQPTAAAEQQGMTLSALVERYPRVGLAIDTHPGSVFKSGPSGRRAALAGGADVWEIVDALRTTTGPDHDRVTTVADQLGIHPRQVAIARGYAADHPDEIEERITANQDALAQAEQRHQARQRLLDSA